MPQRPGNREKRVPPSPVGAKAGRVPPAPVSYGLWTVTLPVSIAWGAALSMSSELPRALS